MIDPDNLIDTHDVANLLGLSSPRAVSVYRHLPIATPSPGSDPSIHGVRFQKGESTGVGEGQPPQILGRFKPPRRRSSM